MMTTPTTGPVFVQVDPRTLIVGANARTDVKLDPDFVNSIRERGVLVPVVAHADADNQLVVLYGQRRTLAAVQTERPTIPAWVVEKPEDADRLIDQLNENDHRAPLTTADRATAYQQLTAMGVPAGTIARKVARPRPEIDTALRIAGSTLATKAAARWDLTLPQAAALAEFEGDKEAVTALVAAARSGGFDHLAQKLRDARVLAAAHERAAESLRAAGITLIDRPAWDDKKTARLDRLNHDGQPLTPEGHAGCPGHAAFLAEAWVDPDDPDGAKDNPGLDQDDDLGEDGWEEDGWDEEDPDETSPQAGSDDEHDEAERPQRVRGWAPVYVCVDFAAHGHTDRYAYSSGTGRKKAADMTDEEREAARAQRRDVIQSNKDWDSAEKVRRAWLANFLTRKTAPKDAASFIARSLARGDYQVTDAVSGRNKLAHELLGLGDKIPTYGQTGNALADLVDGATEARAQLLALGLILCAYEESTSRQTWRSVYDTIARYLHYLEANGYELAPVEKRAAGDPWQPTPQPRTPTDPSLVTETTSEAEQE